jgi:heparin/heparan-sulfate lyase
MTNLEKCPPAEAPGDLPPARHFENMGQVFMRSGAGPNDTYAMFAGGGVLESHRHYDANHFVIYKRGFLALDTGTREGNTDNLQNYYAQTVAHNCILIKMPGEPPSKYWNGTVYGQAGGQYKVLGSRVIAFQTGPRFTYVAGDATPTYRAEKCSQMVRQLVFIPPDHFVVFDRVTATKPEYAKTWLLHHANEPVVSGTTWRSDQDRGRIICRTLLPEDAVPQAVGGPGKEFLADGVNYSIIAGVSAGIRDSLPTTTTLNYTDVPELMGRWRVEVTPGAARTEDLFLHVMQVGDQALAAMDEIKLDKAADTVTVRFDAAGTAVALSFATAGEVGGHVTISRGGGTLVDQVLARDVMPQQGLATAGSASHPD